MCPLHVPGYLPAGMTNVKFGTGAEDVSSACVFTCGYDQCDQVWYGGRGCVLCIYRGIYLRVYDQSDQVWYLGTPL